LPRRSALSIDAAAVLIVSVAICCCASQLHFMTALVPLIIALRLLAWRRIVPGDWPAELLFFACCTAIGAFNDWSTVDRHGVYRYLVPTYWPALTTIPLWMLLFWGQILRFVATLAEALRALPGGVRFSAPRLALQLAIVALTRWQIHLHFADPLRSWLPFALALALYLVVLAPGARTWTLIVLAAIVGPAVEIAYIRLAHLHHYQLGVIGGVPIWIALWWVLGTLIWCDLARWIQAGARRCGRVIGGAV